MAHNTSTDEARHLHVTALCTHDPHMAHDLLTRALAALPDLTDYIVEHLNAGAHNRVAFRDTLREHSQIRRLIERELATAKTRMQRLSVSA